MHRFLIVALAVASGLLPSIVSAQESPLHKGGWTISGSASLTQTQTQADGGAKASGTAALIEPSALYFFTSRLAIGGSGRLGFSNPGSIWSYGAGPEVRYYIAHTGSKTLPYVRVSIVPEWTRSEIQVGSNTQLDPFSTGPVRLTTRSVASTGAAGITQMIATHIGVTGEAFYTQDDHHSSDSIGNSGITGDTKSSTYGLDFGLSILVH